MFGPSVYVFFQLGHVQGWAVCANFMSGSLSEKPVRGKILAVRRENLGDMAKVSTVRMNFQAKDEKFMPCGPSFVKYIG